MLKKGGFQRLLNDHQQGALLKALAKGSSPSKTWPSTLPTSKQGSKCCCSTSGRAIAHGVQMAGANPAAVQRQVQDRLDRGCDAWYGSQALDEAFASSIDQSEENHVGSDSTQTRRGMEGLGLSSHRCQA